MEGKIWGIVLSVAGLAGLVLAVIYINVAESIKHVNVWLGAGILGTIAFFIGLRLIPTRSEYNQQLEVSRNSVSE